jgi:hypothetical protein
MAGLIKEIYGINAIFLFGGITGMTTCLALLLVSLKRGMR